MNGLIGQVISERYRVDAFLGKGGMSEVYKVWDRNRSVHLAMKVLHEDLAEDKVFLRRFRREAKTLAKLQHPNIVRCYGLEQDNDLVFILMDYVEGTTLRKEIFRAKESLSVGRILEIMQPVCAALYYAHKSGFVHCDVKPANIMIHRNGTIYVSDFGIARMTEAATVTMVGAGTPAYMAPEQARGEEPIPQTDIYALGVILFEMVTGGERPFTGEHARTTGSTSEKIRWEQLNRRPPSPRDFNPDISPELATLILTCLNKEPASRYHSTLELLDAFERAVAKPKTNTPLPEKEPPSAPEPPTKPVRQYKASEGRKKPAEAVASVNPPRFKIPDFLCSFKSARSRSIAALETARAKIWKYKWGFAAIAGVITLCFAVIAGVIALYFAAALSPVGKPNGQVQRPGQPSNAVSNVAKLYFTSNQDGRAEIYKLMPNGDIVRVTNTKGDAESWSPFIDERQIVYFTSNRDGKAEIYKILPNGQTARVTSSPGKAESWSPFVDNQQVVYFTSNRDGKAEIYKILPNGQTNRVTNTTGKAQSWSPFVDNNQIVYFTSDREGKAEIYKILPNGKIDRVTNTTGKAQSWSPFVDNRQVVYFASNREGKAEIYKILPNGKIDRVTNTAGEAESWAPMIGDKQIVYFTSNRNNKTMIYSLDSTGKVTSINTERSQTIWAETLGKHHPGHDDYLMKVDSTRGPQGSGIILHKGDAVTIDYISGKWSIDADNYALVDANGHGALSPEMVCSVCIWPMRTERVGKLLAEIGSAGGGYISVGNHVSFTAKRAGDLYLTINDDLQALQDNSGIITVKITVNENDPASP